MFQGKTLGLVRTESDIGHLCFDLLGSSVNKFNRQTLEELREVIAVIAASDLRGLVCSSAKSSFIVGADIGEFTSVFKLPEAELLRWCSDCNDIFNALEDLPIPTVSAVAGVALGGGFEFCLATNYRVATPAAAFGFPEAGLGICPGFGGTVRAPRVMDVQKAVEWITGGKQNSAAEALTVGAVDAITEPEMLFEAAVDFVEQALQNVDEWQAMRQLKTAAITGANLSEIFEGIRAQLLADKRVHNPAPLRALDALVESVDLERAAALQVEHRIFTALARSEIAGNLVQIFLNDQWLRQKSRQLLAVAHPVKQVAVLGAGIMGGGIAYQSSLKGIAVLMKDIAQQGLDAGINEASQLLQKQVAKGRLSEEKARDVLAGIRPTLSYEGIESADLVIEAVVENPRVKKLVLAEVEGMLEDTTILTSNTSTISITSLASGLQHPERFCGMHFFNPVPLMPLVEVIRGVASSERTIATTVAYAQRLGKTPIIVNDCPGFLVNRILFPYFGAFSQLVRDGADYQQIDAAMEAFGWPMGPAYLLDVVGIDTAVHAQAVMAEGFPQRMAYGFKSVMDILFEDGQFGQKTGSGFYRYEQSAGGRQVKVVDAKIVEALRAAQHGRRDISTQEIVDRMMLAMCLETARCLEDNIVSSPIEADMGLVLGLGFPAFRGGALRYIDSMGLPEFCTLADQYASLGPLYHPTPAMREMAAAGKRYYE
ncbi:MAG: fatty acid oxidation complex subunit alpha FadB [Gammaproteobacteria bacterium]|nr:fatty acid oxidation complex subunit alpha FadB [Gammaproteobacteria bacterium]MDP2349250.1 fatty acid oxidation complex subunit alpha FadB [Gammaproteobacteria bacterium]